MKKKITAFCLSVVLCVGVAVFCGCSCNKKTTATAYDITATLSGNTLTATQTVDFYNSYETTFTTLEFNLFGNAFRKGAKYNPISQIHKSQSYYAGESFGDMVINSVKSNGKDLPFEIVGEDKNVLSVSLDREVFPEENYPLTIDYTLNLANVISRTGVNGKTVNLGNFYPILCHYDNGFYECNYYDFGDPFCSDCANYRLTLYTDTNVITACSGEERATATVNGKKQTVYEIDSARSVAVVCSTEFKVEERQVGETLVKYYYYNDIDYKDALDYTEKALNLFSEKFGKYPYKTFSVVKTQFVQGGMEYPALVMISDELETGAYGEVIVHETAHQWWQTVVGNNETEHAFLDEGLAEYSVVLFFENYKEYGVKRETLIKSCENTFKTFCSVSDKVFGLVDTTMLRSLKDFTSEYEYVNVAYVKPCIMYETLRKTVGEERFFKALARYYKDQSFKVAKPDDLVGAFEKCGADTNGFFKTFFEGKEII